MDGTNIYKVSLSLSYPHPHTHMHIKHLDVILLRHHSSTTISMEFWVLEHGCWEFQDPQDLQDVGYLVDDKFYPCHLLGVGMVPRLLGLVHATLLLKCYVPIYEIRKLARSWNYTTLHVHNY